MTTPKIPEKAIEAAARVFYESQTGGDNLATSAYRMAWMQIAQKALEAAAPPMSAQAFRSAASRWDNDMAQHFEYRTYDVANELENWADDLDPKS